MEKICAVCQKDAKSRCGRCKTVWYCSIDHQQQDWINGHKQKCLKPSLFAPPKNPRPSFSSSSLSSLKESNSNPPKEKNKKSSTDNNGNKPFEWTPIGEENKEGGDKIPVVRTSSTTNTRGEPATLLRPRMAAAYYDGAEKAFDRVSTFQFSNSDCEGVQHANTFQTVKDFLRVRKDVIQFSRMTAGIKSAEGTLTMAEMLRNGTNAAHSLLAGRARHEPIPRQPELEAIFDRMEDAVPQEMPLSFYCGQADATLEAQMLLKDLSAERQDADQEIIAAIATCTAMYIVLQDRIRNRLDLHARGAAANPDVVRRLEEMQSMQTGENVGTQSTSNSKK